MRYQDLIVPFAILLIWGCAALFCRKMQRSRSLMQEAEEIIANPEKYL